MKTRDLIERMTVLMMGLLLSTAAVSTAAAGTINAVNVDVNGGAGTYRGEGVLTAPEDTWNGVSPAASKGDELVDSLGNTTNIGWSLSGDGVSSHNAAAGAGTLLNDYGFLDNSPGQSATLTITGLDSDVRYDLVIFSQGASDGQGGEFTLADTTKRSAGDKAGDRDFVEGGNYVRFDSVTPNADGELAVTWKNVGGGYSAINGFQLRLALPEDDDELTRIVNEADDYDVRLAAANRISDTDFVSLDHEHPAVRHSAVLDTTDQEVLARVAVEDDHETVRAAATKKLKPDADICENIALNDDSARVRLQAVKKITDQNVLAQIANNDTSERVRVAAETSLNTETRVEELTASAGEPRQFLASRIVDGDRETKFGRRRRVTSAPRWVQFKLNKAITLDTMKFLRSNHVRGATVQVKVSIDGEDWRTVFNGKPDHGDENMESVKFEPVDTRYVRFISHNGPGAHGKQNWIYELRIGDLPQEAYANLDTPDYSLDDRKLMKGRPTLEGPFPKTSEEIKAYRKKVLKKGFQRAGHPPEGGDPIRIDSLEELWKYGLMDGVHVKMEPGEYRIDRDNINKFFTSERGEGGAPKLFVFAGDNSYFDLRGVTITVDAKAFGGKHFGRANGSTIFNLIGNNLVFRGLTVDTINKRAIDPKFKPKKFGVPGCLYLAVRADSVLVWDVEITTGGSTPYGYGNLLGKGGGSNLTRMKKGGGIGVSGNHV